MAQRAQGAPAGAAIPDATGRGRRRGGAARRRRRGAAGGLPIAAPWSAHGRPRAQPGTGARYTALVRGRDRYRLRRLELRVPPQVADHGHADALVQALLELLRQRQVLDLQLSSSTPRAANIGRTLSVILCPSSIWLAAMSRNGMLAFAEVVGQRPHDRVAQLPLEVADA